MQGRKQFVPKLFTNFQLPERVPEDNFYRHLKEVIDLRWLYKATAKYYGTEGQVSIDPVVFFRFMMIGYLENIVSDRQIIKTASLRLDMLYFIGYDIDEALPWHSATLIHTTNNLKEAGDLKVEEIICDGNYSSGETLQYLEQEKITAVMFRIANNVLYGNNAWEKTADKRR